MARASVLSVLFVLPLASAFSPSQLTFTAQKAGRVAASTAQKAGRAAASPAMGPFDFLAFGQAAASHILMSDSSMARYVKERIEKKQITFEAAAKEYSTCPSAAKGGDLGAFKDGDMVSAFSDYCYDPDTKVGELGIVRTKFGTHIVKLTKKP
jgi:peptidyl-prolyl cis-trans isomerase C